MFANFNVEVELIISKIDQLANRTFTNLWRCKKSKKDFQTSTHVCKVSWNLPKFVAMSFVQMWRSWQVISRNLHPERTPNPHEQFEECALKAMAWTDLSHALVLSANMQSKRVTYSRRLHILLIKTRRRWTKSTAMPPPLLCQTGEKRAKKWVSKSQIWMM